MFCMETLLDSDMLCWDRLLGNRGAAVASSARRTADRGRSLGCEAVKGREDTAECHRSTPARMTQLTKATEEPTALQPTGPGSGEWVGNAREDHLAISIKAVHAYTLGSSNSTPGYVYSIRYTCLCLK